MKKYYKVFTITLFLIVGTHSLIAQTKKKPWILNVEANAVDVYPVGEDNNPQGPYFDEFFNLTDHWNISFPKITISKYLSDNMAVSVAGSYNKIKKWGEFPGSPKVEVDKLTYLGIDGMFNYYFSGLSKRSKLKPFIGAGAGYTWIEQGQFNIFTNGINKDALVGAATLNGTVGANYWITKNFGLNLQTTYKHSFKEYLVKHWQHSFGVVINLTKADVKKKVEEKEKDRDGDGVPDKTDDCPDVPGLVSLKGCPDSDGDGVADKDDDCPTVFGLKQFKGCKDSDGDGYADNIDECPDVKGTNKGCPEEKKVIEPVVTEKLVYFAFDNSNISSQAQRVLDEVSTITANSSYTILIEGHGDHIGTKEYNYKLSVERAEAVKDYLVSKGLSRELIAVKGEGETKPIASNDTEAGRALNRRAMLTIKVVSN
ncbi:OmpA family protein [Pontimicrobium aquaticum]|uniref:OmpA family protein n=1 Tax=Pontimicrobium aquaticum TaxID=2565367 RepID=A0A4U0EPC2_9FLAO|nr:OmpW family outer membrane protein [Pontimicrobium aquaticum]TJY32182.1 OmpA family protein [Pontimicrobium aquaticum]